MTANLTNPRPDIVFLRRRLKVGENVPAVEVRKSSGITLNGSPDSSPNSVSVQEKSLPGATVPNATGLTFLKEANDACRMNKRQSAIGSLIVGNAMVAGWEMQDGSSGYLYNKGITATESPETEPAKFNKQALVEFHKELLVVGLKNVRNLKRLIVVPKTGETLQAETIGGTGVVMEFEPFTALYISVIDSVLEFRKEDFRGTLTETFNLHTVKPQTATSNTPSLRTLFS
jgi:hypothetical protein